MSYRALPLVPAGCISCPIRVLGGLELYRTPTVSSCSPGAHRASIPGRILLVVALLGIIVFATACARAPREIPGAEWIHSRLALRVSLDAPQFSPGAPVKAEVALTGIAGDPFHARMLDHASVSFLLWTKGKDEAPEMRFVEPVFSPKEPTGARRDLAPRECASRSFVFTTLTLNRGEFSLQAIYSQPDEKDPDYLHRVYAAPVDFAVQGEKVFAHRYVNGLLAREDAVELAVAKIGARPRSADAILIRDEKGFEKWWVNLEMEGPDGAPIARSCFVDPYLAVVWGEARPFTREDKQDAPPLEDSRRLREVRDQLRR